MSDVKQITREEMQALITARCPTMSAPTRKAVMQGAELQLANGERFQAPQIADSEPTHKLKAKLQKVGDTWNDN